MNVNEYQKAVMKNINKNNWTGCTLPSCVCGLKCEADENVDSVKRHMLQGYELDIDKLANNLGYIAWYLAVTSEAIGYDLETILKMNIDKHKQRNIDYFGAIFDDSREPNTTFLN